MTSSSAGRQPYTRVQKIALIAIPAVIVVTIALVALGERIPRGTAENCTVVSVEFEHGRRTGGATFVDSDCGRHVLRDGVGRPEVGQTYDFVLEGFPTVAIAEIRS